MTASPSSDEFAPWIGQFEDGDRTIDIYERNGLLYAEGLGSDDRPLDRAGPCEFGPLRLVQAGAAVRVRDRLLPRSDLGAARIASFRKSLRAGPTPGTGIEPPRQPLVTIADIPGIHLDIRYATSNNFMGFPVYDRPAAYVRPAVRSALVRVQAAALQEGYSLIVHDAYRPWAITKFFWDIVPPEFRAFVADPATGSVHNRGCAVDLSLCDAATGEPLAMPSGYDEPTARAQPDYGGGTSVTRSNRDFLIRAMRDEGFTVQHNEWWHFDFTGWETYPIENTGFEFLDRGCQA